MSKYLVEVPPCSNTQLDHFEAEITESLHKLGKVVHVLKRYQTITNCSCAEKITYQTITNMCKGSNCKFGKKNLPRTSTFLCRK